MEGVNRYVDAKQEQNAQVPEVPGACESSPEPKPSRKAPRPSCKIQQIQLVSKGRQLETTPKGIFRAQEAQAPLVEVPPPPPAVRPKPKGVLVPPPPKSYAGLPLPPAPTVIGPRPGCVEAPRSTPVPGPIPSSQLLPRAFQLQLARNRLPAAFRHMLQPPYILGSLHGCPAEVRPDGLVEMEIPVDVDGDQDACNTGGDDDVGDESGDAGESGEESPESPKKKPREQ